MSTAPPMHPGLDSYPCDRCGVVYAMDASLPFSQWKAIAGDEWSILCLWCIDALAAEKGTTYTAYLYFVGLAGNSALYEGDKDERWPEIIARRDARISELEAEAGALREALGRIAFEPEIAYLACADIPFCHGGPHRFEGCPVHIARAALDYPS